MRVKMLSSKDTALIALTLRSEGDQTFGTDIVAKLDVKPFD